MASGMEWNDNDSARSDGDEINVLGNGRYVGQKLGGPDSAGGNPDKGQLDQTLPTGYVAQGQEVSSKDDFRKGVRSGMSSTKNMEIYKGSRRETRR